jgi:hypothetical protein
MLFGVFATHSPESCPLNNKCSKKMLLQVKGKMESNKKKYGIDKTVGFYISALEHLWIMILDAKSAHQIEQFCVEIGISTISTIKIVPISDLDVLLKKLKSS